MIEQLEQWFAHGIVRDATRAVVIVLAGLLVARLIAGRIKKAPLRPQHRFLASRVVTSVIVGITAAWALSEIGLSVGVILGAAGVLTVAIGFAAQTAVSNLISGVFLVVERPFELDDVITVNGRTGEVIAIDLMSTKLRTFDNLYVRIPNEVLLKAEVVNLTHYEIRRHDLQLSVAYGTDLEQVRATLLEAARSVPLCLDEPAPAFFVLGFGDSGINLQYSVWAHRENFIEMRNQLQRAVVEMFARDHIEIPYPHRALVPGAAPVAVKVVDS